MTTNTQDWHTMISILEDANESGYKRSQAFSRFIHSDAHIIYLDLISNLLSDPNSSFRNEVIRQVVRNRREEYYPLLADALENEDEHIVREALRGLETCHKPAIIQKVVTLKESSTGSIHYEAERTFRKMTDKLDNWEDLIHQSPQSKPHRVSGSMATPQTTVAEPAFTQEKTAEVKLNLNMLPHDTPYPVHRSHRSKHGNHGLNGDGAITQDTSQYTEGLIAAAVSIGTLLILAMILAI